LSKENTIRDFEYQDPVRHLLEDFEIVGNSPLIALLRRPVVPTSLRENVHTAIVASFFGLSSLDHVRKTYPLPDLDTDAEDPIRKAYELYITSYITAKEYIYKILKKVDRKGLSPARVGVFGASVVLQRLTDSFFSAHLLYLLGNRYEGHAVSRLILEQIAWAYAAIDIKDIEKIVTTKAISQLKKKLPAAGKLYGYLSEKAHLDYNNHREFLFREDEKYAFLRTQPNYREYSSIILELADLFGIVWELSQFEYISTPETIAWDDTNFNINQTRPFLVESQRLLLAFDDIKGKWLEIVDKGYSKDPESF
jgi:hypothetical protein